VEDLLYLIEARIRRVKCDELKPACLRCTSTGRKCDGYIEPPPRKKRESTYSVAPMFLSLYSPSFDVLEDVNERRGYHYFRSRVVQDISGCFELEFWDNLVLQVSHAEPTVRHALLALSSLYEAYEYNRCNEMDQTELTGNQTGTLPSFALEQYTKAVGLLAGDLSIHQPSFQAILMSCLIFVWIEFVQNNLDTALRHLQSGLQILEDLQQSSGLSHVDASLPRLFRRLHSQARFHGSPTSDFNSNPTRKDTITVNAVPRAYSSILEARNSLDEERDSIFQFIRQMYNPDFVRSTWENHPFPDPLSLEAIRQSHVRNLEKWHSAYQNIPSLSHRPPDTKQSAGRHLLEIQYISTTIILETLLEASEMANDRLKPLFERMISLAERLIHNTPGKGALKLSLDTGVISPLFQTALKCRFPRLRRRAISLLKLAPEREGMWHRASIVEMAEWKAAKEGHGYETLPEDTPLPECARIHSERSRIAVVDGKRVTILQFKRGSTDRSGDREFEEEVTELSATMGEML
jgi:hypothetical protein